MKIAKTFLLPLMLILSVFLLTVVSAGSVNVRLFYDSTDSNSLTITNGDIEGIIVNAESEFENSMTIKLDILNSAGNVITNILDTYTTSDSYFKSLTVGQSVYSGAGDYTLKATVTASSGQSNTDTLSLKILPISAINHLPVITSTPITQIDEGQSYSYQVTATDSDGDSLTYSLTQAPSWLTINAQGRITGTAPQVSADTSYAVTVRVSDGKGFVTQSFTVTIKDVPVNPPTNHLPVITSTPASLYLYEGNAYTYQVTSTDADGDTLIYALTQNPTWLSINSAGLISGLTPQVNSDTPYTITIRVSDGKGGIATQTYIFTVRDSNFIPVNHLPVITSTPITQINEGQNYNYQVTATDSDGDTLTYSLIQNTSWFSISNTGLISGIAPQVNSDTSSLVTVIVGDGKDSVGQLFILTVKNVISPPSDTTAPVITIISPVNGQTYTSSLVSLEMTTNEDASAAWYVLDNGADSYISRAPGSYRHFIDAVLVGDGTHTITFYVRDTSQNLGRSTITFYVDTSTPPSNNLPIITSTPITSVNEGFAYTYQVTATDVDGDTFTYTLTQNPSWLSISSQGRITGTARQVISDTSYTVTIRVSDGKGGIAIQSYTLTVRDIPSTPGGNTGGQTNKKAGVKYLSDAKGTKDYLSQFNPKTTVEEEEILGVEEQPRLLSQTLWIWLLGVGILIFITALIILWIRR